MSSTRVLVWVRGRAKQKCSLTFCVFGQTRSKCSSSSTFPKSQPQQSLSTYGMPFHAPNTTLGYVLPHRNRARAFCNTTNVTQVAFTFVQRTLEAHVSCLHTSPNLAVVKELFNENHQHIIFHLFYIQHCVGKTWRGWGPNLLVDRAPCHRSNINRLH
jgi:hypothetical protein